ncbi:Prp18-domain-containing protein [Gloeophyllum trabeum ATCC 11539]|uniref:Pre-mRNA-splicing factor 18 n=1 Tax=Gloeophyllum trabeum (strain ATCC 11539 / FP-39264 / Madison 617) TaxID=670483 RepID=S7RNE3_GLOTA|nr:Prp18-domain-containing protein [Gloeophyllum trabeum ATCC 11539]EPQ54289.1 Prp18-domain-containing protein [Gloeophyllum trabeum ATCC 11539]
MDALKAEIANKRKALEDPALAARPNKYVRRGELERLREEKERQEREEKERQKALKAEEERKAAEARAAARARSTTPSRSRSRTPGAPQSPAPADPNAEPGSSFNISNEETIRRLRSKGQPIRLFGESDKERRLRLRALELIEEKDHPRIGGQNDFKKALEDVELKAREKSAAGDKEKESKWKGEDYGGVLDLELVKTDPDKLYPIIYYAIKRTLKEWEQALEEREEHVKRSTQGKLAAATQKQAADYLKPLLKLLRARNLPSDVLARIAEIVHYMQKRQYQRANDAYLRLSIGNAPWPIGVTMVGIHERSAREKISSDQVAHVLNDEVSRKYIQSLKRLLTFAQTKYPPDDATQRMG